MILLLDTSTGVCKLTLVDGARRYDSEWQADRTLAKDILSYLHSQLSLQHMSWCDLTALGAFEGPGSFTGLRIGLTVLNTIASSEQIPIVGSRGDNWQALALDKLRCNVDEKIVLPFYGSEARITLPRK